MTYLPGSPLRPRWVYDDGSPVDYLMGIPQRPWGFGSRGLGGSDTSAAGVPAAFEIRRDYLLHLRLRFPVTEWDDVERLVRHLQRAGSATLYPDQDDPSISHMVYGDRPAINEEIRPVRSREPSTLELPISVRRTTSAIFEDAYYGDLLLDWRAGTTGPGSVFTRTGTGYYIDRNGQLRSEADGVARITMVGPNFDRPALLLEDTRTNPWLFAEELQNAAWTKNDCTIDPDAVIAPDGTLTGDTIVEDAIGGDKFIQRVTPTVTVATDQTVSFRARAAGRTWLWVQTQFTTTRTSYVDLTNGVAGTTDAGHTITVKALRGGWFKITVTFSSEGATADNILVGPASADGVNSYAGDGVSGISVWGLQFEVDAPHASSYMQTVGSPFTRNADSQHFEFPFSPREMAIYGKVAGWVGGQVSRALFRLGSATAAETPGLDLVITAGGTLQAFYDDGTTSAATGAVAAPGDGEDVEFLVTLTKLGVLDLAVSIDRGAQVDVASAAGGALPVAWSDTRFYLNSAGTTQVGFNRFECLRVGSVIRTLVAMRAA